MKIKVFEGGEVPVTEPRYQTPMVSPYSAGFKQLQRLGEGLFKIYEKQKQAERLLKAAELENEMGRSFVDLEVALAKDQDYSTLMERRGVGSRKIKELILKKAAGDKQLEQGLLTAYNRYDYKNYGSTRRTENKWFLDASIASLDKTITDKINMMALAKDEDDYTYQRGIVHTLIDANVKLGVLTQQQATDAKQNIDFEADVMRAENAIDDNPDAFLVDLKAGAFKNLSPEKHEDLEEKAERVIKAEETEKRNEEKRKKADAKEAKAIWVDEKEKDWIKLYIDNNLTETMIVKENEMPADKQRLWLGLISKPKTQISDKVTYATWSETVHTKSDSITVDDIWRVDPTKLSVDDKESLSTTLRVIQGKTGDPRKTADATRAHQILTRARNEKVIDDLLWGDYSKLLDNYILQNPDKDYVVFVEQLLEHPKYTITEKIFDFFQAGQPQYEKSMEEKMKGLQRTIKGDIVIPEGAVLVGKTKDGKDAYKLPDGTYWSP